MTTEHALENIPAKELTSYKDQIEFAQLMAKAAILPKHLHGNPGNCLAVISVAKVWNMNPFLVGQCTSLIPKRGGGDTLMFEGKLVQAAINNSGMLNGRLKFAFEGKDKTTTCTVTGHIRGETDPVSVTIAMPPTQNSPLWSGTQDNKEQQLSYLATRTWARRYLPEVMLGVYTPEDPWEDRADAPHVQRNEAVAGRVAQLEAGKAETGIPEEGKDEFIDGEVVIAQKDPVPAHVQRVETKEDKPVSVDKSAQGRQITDSPEDRTDDLEAPIPTFSDPNIVIEPKCKTCGDRQVVEDEAGKGPCPDCSKPKKGKK